MMSHRAGNGLAWALLSCLVLIVGCSHEGTIAPQDRLDTEGDPSGTPPTGDWELGTLGVQILTDSLTIDRPLGDSLGRTAPIDGVVHVYRRPGTLPIVSQEVSRSGMASFDLIPGTYAVGFESASGLEPIPGHANPCEGVAVNAGETTELALWFLVPDVPPPASGIDLFARDGDAGVADVVVHLRDDGTGQLLSSAATDATGRLSLDLDPGIYAVEIEVPEGMELWPGEDALRTGIQVHEGSRARILYNMMETGTPLPAGKLSVFVEADSLPVVGVPVTVLNAGATQVVTEGVTDDRGVADFELDPETYAVRIAVPEGLELGPGQENPIDGVIVHPGSTSWTSFGLHDPLAETRGVLQVWATSPAEPLSGLEIGIYPEGSSTPVETGTTGREGMRTFRLDPGLYTVALTIPEGFTLSPSSDNPLHDVSIEADGWMSVRFALVREDPEPPGEGRGVLFVHVEADSLPVGDVGVIVHGPGMLEIIRRELTNQGGDALFDLEAGTYGIGLEPPEGYQIPPGQENPQWGFTLLPDDTLHVLRGLLRTP